MTKWKNIKTDTMLQYLSHGSGIRNVRHMDVYLDKRYAKTYEPAFLTIIGVYLIGAVIVSTSREPL